MKRINISKWGFYKENFNKKEYWLENKDFDVNNYGLYHIDMRYFRHGLDEYSYKQWFWKENLLR